MVLILLSDLAVFIQLDGCSRPVYNILACGFIIDEFRSPCTSCVLRRNLRDPRFAPVYKIIRLPNHDAVASASACACPVACIMINTQVCRDHIVFVTFRRACDKVVTQSALADIACQHCVAPVEFRPVQSVLTDGEVCLLMRSCRLVADKVYEQISHIVVFGYFLGFRFYCYFICLCYGILSVF